MLARAASPDLFEALADPRRRVILELLARGEWAVNALVKALGEAQPLVSKHLGVLKGARLVAVRKAGRQRFYRLDAAELKKAHDWTGAFERLWTEQLDQLDQYLARKSREDKRG